MSAISNRERLLKDKVIDKCWAYLNANFNNFSEQNKLKILIALCTKSIPQEVTGNMTHSVQMGNIQKGTVTLEFKIGNSDAPGNTESPGQATPDNNQV